MPITMVANDIYQVTLACRHENGQNGLMICYYKCTAADLVTTIENASQDISAHFAAAIKALLTNHARYEGLRIRRVEPTPSDVIFSVNDEGDGEATGDSLPTYVSSLISLRTGLSGPSYRGRKYVPFPSESQNHLGGTPDDLFLALLLTLSNKFLDTIHVDAGDTGADLSPGIYRKNRAPRFVPWDHALIRRTWTHQKRRFDSVFETSVIITPS